MARASSEELARLSRRAAEMAGAGRHHEAVEIWERLRSRAPDNVHVAAGLGAALLEAKRFVAARDWLIASCQRHPRDVLLYRLQAHALLHLKERGPAIGALFMALDLAPQDVQTNADLGRALFLDGTGTAALPYASLAFEADLSSENAALLSGILIELGRLDETLEVIARAFRAGASLGTTWMLKSLALQFLDRFDEALEAARKAVIYAPDDANIRHNLAAALLLDGALTAEAWGMYESRAGFTQMKDLPSSHRVWTGSDIAGKTILLHAEQGLGDTLQFVRFAPLVAARGATVILIVQRALVSLLEGMPGVEAVLPSGAKLPPHDLICPLLSLPGVFGTTLETIPPVVPYTTSFERGSIQDALQAGLVWSGNPGFIEDRRRSIPASLLAPLDGMPGVDFHSLQLGVERLPLSDMRDGLCGVGDFLDTARRIAPLDLVIAVDTSVAHLAATMGKPVWLLARHNGCWRWLRDRTDSPWYPTVRIYRQSATSGWAPVILQVRDDLARLASRRHELTTLAA